MCVCVNLPHLDHKSLLDILLINIPPLYYSQNNRRNERQTIDPKYIYIYIYIYIE